MKRSQEAANGVPGAWIFLRNGDSMIAVTMLRGLPFDVGARSRIAADEPITDAREYNASRSLRIVVVGGSVFVCLLDER